MKNLTGGTKKKTKYGQDWLTGKTGQNHQVEGKKKKEKLQSLPEMEYGKIHDTRSQQLVGRKNKKRNTSAHGDNNTDLALSDAERRKKRGKDR